MNAPRRSICWKPVWNGSQPGIGLEHLLLAEQSADGMVLTFDEARRPFRLAYRLAWDGAWNLARAELTVVDDGPARSLVLQPNGHGEWFTGDGMPVPELDGCRDIDIWPTPFTNTFPIRRSPLTVGERREFRVAWVCAPELTVRAQPQAYTRLAARRYGFESLDGSGFQAELAVDADGVVLDYPGFFVRTDGGQPPADP